MISLEHAFFFQCLGDARTYRRMLVWRSPFAIVRRVRLILKVTRVLQILLEHTYLVLMLSWFTEKVMSRCVSFVTTGMGRGIQPCGDILEYGDWYDGRC